MIPDSIKTGFGTEADFVQGGAPIELQQKITSIMMVLMKRSLQSAATYVMHHGGTNVEAIHISKGIKLEATTFFDSDGLEDETEKMQETIFGDMDMITCEKEESDDEVISSSSDDEDELDPEKMRIVDTFVDTVGDEFESAEDIMAMKTDGETCQCRVCKNIDTIDEVWASWDVSGDPIKAFLKHHVERTEQMVREQLIDVE